eukprot:gb/GEZN01003966.1/.p1 GENE.gb/GEZN01003966.1/~~gb/GEZN01003966.1/.p1  ORF type:complete len:612 (-),score=76.47 gb/GEZN01003966.1/:209-2044(-)
MYTPLLGEQTTPTAPAWSQNHLRKGLVALLVTTVLAYGVSRVAVHKQSAVASPGDPFYPKQGIDAVKVNPIPASFLQGVGQKFSDWAAKVSQTFSHGEQPESLSGRNQVKQTVNTAVTTPDRKHHAIVIIGGGIAGLHTALQLQKAGKTGIKVYEGRGGVGGRVQTTRDDQGKVLYNNFAWRISETNKHMLALAKELGIELRQQYTDPQPRDTAQHTTTHARNTPRGRAPLSPFAERCLTSTNFADEADRATGYAGRTAQITFPGESHGIVHHVVVNGMDQFANKLNSKLANNTVNVDHLCTDVRRLSDGKYLVDLMVNKDGKFKHLAVTCDTLILAAPPVSLRSLSIAKDGLYPVLSAIHQRRLAHVYVKSSSKNVPDHSDKEDRIYQGFPDSILQQVVSGDYGSGFFQAGYVSDRFERVWRELQFQGPAVVKLEVAKQLAKLKLPAVQGLSIDQVHLQNGFVHRWQIEAHVNGKTKQDLMEQAVYPSPARLPRLYLVGEAYSSQQGWTEGALLTSFNAVNHILKSPTKSLSKFAQTLPKPIQKEGSNVMTYKGLIADVSEWRERHPGGPGAIDYYISTGIDDMFDQYHGGWTAPLATVFGLQSGVYRSD